MFNSFVTLNNSFFIAHGKIVSLFDVHKDELIDHFFYDDKIIKIFKNEKNDKEYNLGLILGENLIKLIDTTNSFCPRSWYKT